MLKRWTTFKLQHKHYAMIITLSSCGCCIIAICLPEYNHVAAFVGTATNVLWAWEP